MDRFCFFVPDPKNPEWFQAMDAIGSKYLLDCATNFPAQAGFLPKERKFPEVLEVENGEEAIYLMLGGQEHLRDRAVTLLSTLFVRDTDFRRNAVGKVLETCSECDRLETAAAFSKALAVCGDDVKTPAEKLEAVSEVVGAHMPLETLAQWFAASSMAAGTPPEKIVRKYLMEFSGLPAYRIGDAENAPVWVHKSWVDKNVKPLKNHGEYLRQRNMELFGTPLGASAVRFRLPGRIAG